MGPSCRQGQQDCLVTSPRLLAPSRFSKSRWAAGDHRGRDRQLAGPLSLRWQELPRCRRFVGAGLGPEREGLWGRVWWQFLLAPETCPLKAARHSLGPQLPRPAGSQAKGRTWGTCCCPRLGCRTGPGAIFAPGCVGPCQVSVAAADSSAKSGAAQLFWPRRPGPRLAVLSFRLGVTHSVCRTCSGPRQPCRDL